MPIQIIVKDYGHQGNEYDAALELKSQFERDFSGCQAKGKILIASSVQIYGGTIRDIDLIILGELEGYKTKLNTKFRNRNNIIFGPKENDIEVRNFCFVVELKDHDPRHLKFDNFNLYANYNGYYRNVSDQSERQKYEFKKFIEENTNGKVPHIVNLIWLRQVLDPTCIPNYKNKNILPANFNFNKLLTIAIDSDENFLPISSNGQFVLSSFTLSLKKMDEIFNYFGEQKKQMGNITRSKVQLITQNAIDKQLKDFDAEKEVILLQGLAGTGKTSKLLRIAYILQENYNARCLILTYNRALVGDIKRLLGFADVSDRLDSRTVSIDSMQHFFCKMMKEFSGDLDITISELNFAIDYEEGLTTLASYINERIINEKDIEEKKKHCPELNWDYVLIDEGQDWNDKEKDILQKFYSKGHLVVADGIDQMIRGIMPQNWIAGLKPSQFAKEKSVICLRQKALLTKFSNAFAKSIGLKGWKEKENNLGAKGGEIIIDSSFPDELLLSLKNECLQSENSEYDLMILVPPSLVINKESKNSSFAYKDHYESLGLDIFDGTNDYQRMRYASVHQIRVYQYDSCRGLEGWIVVCRDIDDFIQYKFEDYVKNKRDREDPNAMDTFEDRRKEYVRRWLMMAVTRPIDTLVITVRDPQSKIANILREISSINDFITCRI